MLNKRNLPVPKSRVNMQKVEKLKQKQHNVCYQGAESSWASRTASASLGTDYARLWICTGKINIIHPKDIPSVVLLMVVKSAIYHSKISQRRSTGMRSGAGYGNIMRFIPFSSTKSVNEPLCLLRKLYWWWWSTLRCSIAIIRDQCYQLAGSTFCHSHQIICC